MKNSSYFDLLLMEQRYDIDKNELEDNFLAKQLACHPDRVPFGKEKSEAVEVSMLLNEAYKILKDDYKRAEYLLKINGVEYNEQILSSRLSHDELENILEEYETLEKMSNILELRNKEQKKLTEESELVSELSSAFACKNFSKALDLTVRLKYLTNLVGNIKLKIKDADS